MEFLNNPTKSTPKITRWPLTNLLKMHKIIDIPIQLVPTEDPEPSCISEMLESEGLIREIKTKEKKERERIKLMTNSIFICNLCSIAGLQRCLK